MSSEPYKMFVRSLETNPMLKICGIETELKRENNIHEVQIGGASIKFFSN